MKVPNGWSEGSFAALSLSRLQNEGSQPRLRLVLAALKSIKATE